MEVLVPAPGRVAAFVGRVGGALDDSHSPAHGVGSPTSTRCSRALLYDNLQKLDLVGRIFRCMPSLDIAQGASFVDGALLNAQIIKSGIGNDQDISHQAWSDATHQANACHDVVVV